MMSDAIRTILVPTDFSDAARSAAAFSRDLAERTRADIHLLHVHPTYEHHPVQRMLAALRESGQSVPSVEAHVRKLLEEIASTLEGVEVRLEFREGEDLTGTVLEVARSVSPDVIVVGRSAHRTLANFTAGNLGVRLAGQGERPIVVVPEGEDRHVRKVAIPVDFSDNARNALTTAGRMAELYGATLSVVYILERKIVPVFQDTGLFAIEVLEPDPEISARAKEALIQFYEGSYGPQVDVELSIREGEPESQLLAFIEQTGIDLVVMAATGLGPVKKSGLGGLTERMMRRSPCPVYVSER